MGDVQGSEKLRELATRLAQYSDLELAKAIELINEEMERRYQNAKNNVATLERIFKKITTNDNVAGERQINKPKRARREKTTGADNKKQRAPRGALQALIKDALKDGGKTRAELSSLARQQNISQGSIATLLNRMKKNKHLVHDGKNGLYSLPAVEMLP